MAGEDEVQELTQYQHTEVSPNDVIILRLPNVLGSLSQEAISRIRNSAKEVFPNNKVLVLSPRIDLEIVSPQELEEEFADD